MITHPGRPTASRKVDLNKENRLATLSGHPLPRIGRRRTAVRRALLRLMPSKPDARTTPTSSFLIQETTMDCSNLPDLTNAEASALNLHLYRGETHLIKDIGT